MTRTELLPPEAAQFLDENPEYVAQLARAEGIYRVFEAYLRLTQSRVVVSESQGSTLEADLSATLQRANY